MKSKVKSKRNSSAVKEVVYVPVKNRRGQSSLSMRSVSLSPPTPSPSKSHRSARGSESPAKRSRPTSPTPDYTLHDATLDWDIPNTRQTKVRVWFNGVLQFIDQY